MKRTPLLRKTPLKRTAATLRRSRLAPRRVRPPMISDRVLDDLCRDLTFARDRCTCLKCGFACTVITHRPDGSPVYHGIQWAHVTTRGVKILRWDQDNVMTLCAGCHLWWHHYPLEAAAWFRERFPERAERITFKCQTIRIRTLDRAAIRLALQTDLKKLRAA